MPTTKPPSLGGRHEVHALTGTDGAHWTWAANRPLPEKASALRTGLLSLMAHCDPTVSVSFRRRLRWRRR